MHKMVENGAKHEQARLTRRNRSPQGKLSPIAGLGFRRAPVKAGGRDWLAPGKFPDILVAEEETLAGREGGRWAAQRRPLGGREGSWRFRREPLRTRDSHLRGWIFPPGRPSVGGPR